MPFVEQIIRAGKTIEVVRQYVGRYNQACTARGQREAPTSAKMARVNERQAEAKLRRLLNANFGPGDIHEVLTYSNANRPETGQEAREWLTRYMRKLRYHYGKHGIPLRYVTVTEYRRKRIHHHLVLTAAPRQLLKELWTAGAVDVQYLDDSGQYGDLARYLVKETNTTIHDDEPVFRKRWNPSRNLVKPVVEEQLITRGRIGQPLTLEGYTLERDRYSRGVNDWGYEYEYCSFVQL